MARPPAVTGGAASKANPTLITNPKLQPPKATGFEKLKDDLNSTLKEMKGLPKDSRTSLLDEDQITTTVKAEFTVATKKIGVLDRDKATLRAERSKAQQNLNSLATTLTKMVTESRNDRQALKNTARFVRHALKGMFDGKAGKRTEKAIAYLEKVITFLEKGGDFPKDTDGVLDTLKSIGSDNNGDKYAKRQIAQLVGGISDLAKPFAQGEAALRASVETTRPVVVTPAPSTTAGDKPNIFNELIDLAKDKPGWAHRTGGDDLFKGGAVVLQHEGKSYLVVNSNPPQVFEKTSKRMAKGAFKVMLEGFKINEDGSKGEKVIVKQFSASRYTSQRKGATAKEGIDEVTREFDAQNRVFQETGVGVPAIALFQTDGDTMYVIDTPAGDRDLAHPEYPENAQTELDMDPEGFHLDQQETDEKILNDLDKLHAKKMYHRDMKPGNVMENGTLVDWGELTTGNDRTSKVKGDQYTRTQAMHLKAAAHLRYGKDAANTLSFSQRTHDKFGALVTLMAKHGNNPIKKDTLPSLTKLFPSGADVLTPEEREPKIREFEKQTKAYTDNVLAQAEKMIEAGNFSPEVAAKLTQIISDVREESARMEADIKAKVESGDFKPFPKRTDVSTPAAPASATHDGASSAPEEEDPLPETPTGTADPVMEAMYDTVLPSLVPKEVFDITPNEPMPVQIQFRQLPGKKSDIEFAQITKRDDGKFMLSDKYGTEDLLVSETELRELSNGKLPERLRIMDFGSISNGTTEATFVEGKKPGNKHLNQYKNVIANDASRVKIENHEDAGLTSDYANANHMPSVGGRRQIAMDGATPNSTHVQLTMLEQQNVRVVKKVTSYVEGGRVKATPIFPKDVGTTATFGNYTMGNLGQVTYGKTTYTLLLQQRPGKEPRLMLHKDVGAWPDHGVPKDLDQILSLNDRAQEAKAFEELTRGLAGGAQLDTTVVTAEQMRSLVSDYKKDISTDGAAAEATHCSAGIGRTGTSILVDMMKEKIDKLKAKLKENNTKLERDEVEIQIKLMVQDTLEEIRGLKDPTVGRAYSVQTGAQYEYAYQAALEYFYKGAETSRDMTRAVGLAPPYKTVAPLAGKRPAAPPPPRPPKPAPRPAASASTDGNAPPPRPPKPAPRPAASAPTDRIAPPPRPTSRKPGSSIGDARSASAPAATVLTPSFNVSNGSVTFESDFYVDDNGKVVPENTPGATFISKDNVQGSIPSDASTGIVTIRLSRKDGLPLGKFVSLPLESQA